jgi:AcrR family transcriptional regulator
MPPAPRPLQRSPAIPRAERERRVLDAAAELFYARGVHEVGMDELIAATGLGKATVYRLFATKDELIGAYLRRLAQTILAAIDADIARHREDPAAAISAIFAAISEDLARPEFRGCPFNNASIEFADPDHPARVAARDYRAELHRRLTDLAQATRPDAGPQLGAQLAVLADGMYTSAAHLGPDGPAATGPALVDALLRDRR